MVGQDYMLEQPPAPPAWKQFIDLEIIPACANAFGAAEAVLERIAVRGRTRPLLALRVAFGIGMGLGALLRRS